MKNFYILLATLFWMSCASSNSPETQNERRIDNSAVRNPTSSTSVRTSTSNSSQKDKEFIFNYLDQTFQNMENEVKNLSPQQLTFKSAPEKWSVLDCVEHIIHSDPFLFDRVKNALKNSPTPERRTEIKVSDEEVIAMMTDRSFKAKAPEQIAPTNQYSDINSALKDLQSVRNQIKRELNHYSVEDLRNRVIEAPLGVVDLYQFILLISGHAARHTDQIKEIKADSNFPKN